MFPSAVIPQRAWSAPAQNLLPYIPLPNAGTNEYSNASLPQRLNDGKGSVRVDAQTTRFGTLAAYYFNDTYNLNNPYPTAQGGANVPGFSALSNGQAQLASLSDTKTFGPTLVNEFQLSYMRDFNQPYFNTALFSVPALGSPGNASRRLFYGPGMDNWDIALLKETHFTESKVLEFRMETFNTFNHAQFFGANSVDGNINDSTFGQVITAMSPRLMQAALKFHF
ncbi:MAG: hypothetical protein ABSH00_19175 [Bryobacteraceae bacterium]